MKYKNTLLAVKDMERSLDFYQDVLGLHIIADFGTNKTLTGGFCLQTLDSWAGFLNKPQTEIIFQNNAAELYFEEDDFDSFLSKLKSIERIEYVHACIEHPWGQRAIRFYDPDRHIIEVGENIKTVAKRYLAQGMTEEQIAKRMDVAVSYARRLLR